MSNQKKCKHPECRKPFTPVNWFHRYCDNSCRKKAHRAKKRKKAEAK